MRFIFLVIFFGLGAQGELLASTSCRNSLAHAQLYVSLHIAIFDKKIMQYYESLKASIQENGLIKHTLSKEARPEDVGHFFTPTDTEIPPPKSVVGKAYQATADALQFIPRKLSTTVMGKPHDFNIFAVDWWLYEKWINKALSKTDKERSLRLVPRIIADSIIYGAIVEGYNFWDRCYKRSPSSPVPIPLLGHVGATVEEKGNKLLPFGEGDFCNPAWWDNKIENDPRFAVLKAQRDSGADVDLGVLHMKAFVLAASYNEYAKGYDALYIKGSEVIGTKERQLLRNVILSKNPLMSDLYTAREAGAFGKAENYNEAFFNERVRLREDMLNVKRFMPQVLKAQAEGNKRAIEELKKDHPHVVSAIEALEKNKELNEAAKKVGDAKLSEYEALLNLEQMINELEEYHSEAIETKHQ